MDAAAAIHHRLVMLGVRFDVEGDRLRFCPREAVGPELLRELRQYKAEILQRLAQSHRPMRPAKETAAAPNPSLVGRWSPWGDLLACPFCRRQDLTEAAEGLRCAACNLIAWETVGDSIVRADHSDSAVMPSTSAPELYRRRQLAELEEHDRRQAKRLEAARARRAEATKPLFEHALGDAGPRLAES